MSQEFEHEEQDVLEQVVNGLNEIAGDVFDEGDYGPWHFKQLSREGHLFTLECENEWGDITISASIALDLDAKNLNDEEVFDECVSLIDDKLIEAIQSWDEEDFMDDLRTQGYDIAPPEEN